MFRQLFAYSLFAFTGLFPAVHLYALNCVPSAVPPIVHGEGITELTGTLSFVCSGGAANASVTMNLYLFLNVNVTNRLTAAGSTTLSGITLTADNGSGPQVVSSSPVLFSAQTVAFNGATFTLSPAGTITLQVSGVRGAANELDFGAGSLMQETVGVSGSTEFALTTDQVVVGQIEHGLYVGYSAKLICTQAGSPAPTDPTSFASFLAAKTTFTSTRVTEGFASSFITKSDPQSANADTGTRIVAQYSGFPAGAQLYVPTFVAGSDATQPTAGGDFGLPASGGQYTASGPASLVLALVSNTDANGAGGIVTPLPASSGPGPITFDAMSPVTLTNGSGIVVYEVVNSNDSIQESAQFPTFLVLAPNGNGTAVTTSQNVSLGPISTVITATATDPIPRFQQIVPPADCTVVGDCGAGYMPALNVVESSLNYSTTVGGVTTTNYVQVQNSAGGLLQWAASVTYTNGSGWLTVSPASGTNNGTIRIDANAANLAAGTYNAVLTVNAGPLAGTKNIPISFVITAPTVQPPSIQSAVNAATFASGPLTPGSLATLMGSQFAGQTVSVTFNGTPAQVLFSNATQINLLVPASLGSATTAQVVVTVDGVASAPLTANLGASPGIFANGIENQDNTVNSSKQAAAPGSVIQIYATGLPANAAISAMIGSQIVAQPYYAGPAPGLPGVQQIDLILPSTISGNTVSVQVCGGGSRLGTACSPPVAVAIQQ